MKATGVVRRIDDLGRIVIPKEIRKNLRIKNGENLEIFIDENSNIILKKYNQIDKLKDVSNSIAEAIHLITKKNVMITNTDKFVTISGDMKREYLDKPLSGQLIKAIHDRKETYKSEIFPLEITDDKIEDGSFAISPIIAHGDIFGSVIIFSKKEPLEEKEFIITKIVTHFLSKHIEHE